MTFQAILVASFFAIILLCLSQRQNGPTYNSVIRNLSMIICPPNRLGRHQRELAAAARAYARYSCFAHRELSRMRSSYSTVSRQHKRIGYDLGYTRKLNALAETIKVNGEISREIAQLAGEDLQGGPWVSAAGATQDYQQLERIQEVLKHFVRDWSEEGAEERLKTFSPILDIFKKIPLRDRRKTTVLVPGAGLGRLPWEIALLGFDTLSNELSSYMNLGFRFLLSRSTTSCTHQHVIHPFAHWFSHQRTNGCLFRAVAFPDDLPSLFPNSQLRHEESDFLDLSLANGGYDYIVTHFFIDTSHNIITTLQKVHSLLKRGGMWINLGPLLWMNGAQATMELSLEEVLELGRVIGFDIQEDSRRTISSEYTRDRAAMMRWIYEAEFWIAIKR